MQFFFFFFFFFLVGGDLALGMLDQVNGVAPPWALNAL